MERARGTSEDPPSLAELGRLAQAGCAPALDSLLRAIERPLYRYLVCRVMAAPDAEDLAHDLCQETLIRVAAALGRCTFTSDGRLLAWLFTIARNVLLDHMREVRGRAEVRGELYWARSVAPGPLPGSDAPRPDLLETLAAEALAAVPEPTADLLRLRLMGGQSWKKVADTLGIAETAAKRRFQRAQSTLRRRILARIDSLPADARAVFRRRLGPGTPP